ncbi:MAG: hypothetical protein HC781_07950 [Leptolyngbyaceae cyanobacterium CSU_1_4]|nr:hypothetical protein [Leptolyngbyaceae cyanobacterium CSU_1_4]
MDGLLSFWVLSAVFAMVGAALKGLIRPLSLATLAIATLFIAPGKVAETFNAVRTGEVNLALPSLPPPPPAAPTAANPNPTGSVEPVPLAPNGVPSTPVPSASVPSTRIATPPPSASGSPNDSSLTADKGWNLVDLTAQSALPPVSEPDRPTTAAPMTSAPTTAAGNPSPAGTMPRNPPVSALW